MGRARRVAPHARRIDREGAVAPHSPGLRHEGCRTVDVADRQRSAGGQHRVGLVEANRRRRQHRCVVGAQNVHRHRRPRAVRTRHLERVAVGRPGNERVVGRARRVAPHARCIDREGAVAPHSPGLRHEGFRTVDVADRQRSARGQHRVGLAETNRRRRQHRRLGDRDEGDVDPVVRRVVAGGREDAGRAVGEDAGGDAGGQYTVWPAVGGGEVVRGGGVVLRGAVGDDVGRAGLDRDRRREGADLPARFTRGRGDGDGSEQDACGVPQVQDARVGVARVRRAAEVAQLGDGARGVRREPHAELVVGRVGCLGRRRRVGRAEDVRAGAVLVPVGDGDGDRPWSPPARCRR